MTDHDKFYQRETRMQKFRWATPAGIFILGILIAFFGWLGNDYLSQIRNSIIDLKSDGIQHYDKLWSALKSSETRIDCVQNQLSKCCKDSVYCS